MCLTAPGKIIEIKKNIATIDYGSKKCQAKIIQGNYKVGDHVIVKAKIVSEKVSKKQLKGWLELVQDLK